MIRITETLARRPKSNFRPNHLMLGGIFASLLAFNTHAEDKHARHAVHVDHSRHAALLNEPSRTLPVESLPAYNARVVDHYGKKQQFRQDVLGEGPVVITFVYTRCTTICPVSNVIYQSIQKHLDDGGDDKTRLISISIDPDHDRPADLAKMAATFDSGPRWQLVTGERGEISSLLGSFGLRLGAVEDHDPMFLVGNGTNQKYTRISGLPEPEEILRVLADQNEPQS